MKKKVKLNEMTMFQIVSITRGLTMQRVPSGWIHSEGSESFCNTFIPISTEVDNEEYEVIN